MFHLVRETKGFVDARERAVRAQRFRLKLCEQTGVEPQIDLDALIDERRQNPSNLGCASRRVVDPTLRPTQMQFGLVEVLSNPVFLRDKLQRFGCA